MKLYEIEAEIEQCFDEETGEILDVEMLESLELEWGKKIENIALYIKNLKADIEVLKNEKDSFAKRQKSAENKLESLKNFLQEKLNGNKFESADKRVRISYRASKSVECDIAKMVNELSEEEKRVFFKQVEPVPDKTEIKNALAAGAEIAGCQIVEKAINDNQIRRNEQR